MTKKREYRKYINEHRKNVALVWKKYLMYGSLATSDVACNVTKIIGTHDQSKYSGNEFSAYQLKFFPEQGEYSNEANFLKAWNHHQKNNPHHWEYWVMWNVNGCVALPMNLEYILEMLCDWAATAIEFKKDNPSQFYKANKEKMLLHPHTIMWIERKLPEFDRIVLNIINQKK